jgi:hypothetical protein
MVGIITAIKTKDECNCCFIARATFTAIVITNAWIAMVIKLPQPPSTKNCRCDQDRHKSEAPKVANKIIRLE